MTHLIVCREYPPSPYPPGGIGTYVRHIARLFAQAGETVHVIAQRWEGAAAKESRSYGGKLIVHRVSLEEPFETAPNPVAEKKVLRELAVSDCPSQLFSWQAAQLAEQLIQTEPIDVIEAQEWEAPLYYFQLRRAFGLGPQRQPPCLVHLHSPSRLIFQHNQWDVSLTDFLPLSRREEYSIRAADALVCPSRYLATEAEHLFSLKPGEVHVIHYPLGDTPVIERVPDTWARNSVCYIGRLELRKGVVEWVDAAVQVAESHPTVEFEFVGSDTSLTGGVGPSVRDHLNQRIPRRLRPRFRFRESQSHEGLRRLLAKVSVAVVPSRWDNLPFTCIEAMSTGLPVLASPNGGMAELITDGENGWIAPDATASGLALALRRVLGTPGIRRAVMGRQAALTVRRLCSNASVLRRHLEMRSQLARVGACRSRQVPGNRPAPAVAPATRTRSGMGVVITCLDRPELVRACLASIRRQVEPAQMVTLVVDERHRGARELVEEARPERCSVLHVSNSSPRAARTLGVEAVLTAMPRLQGVAVLSEDVRLDPNYLKICGSAFANQPALGVFSSWITCGEPSMLIFPEERLDEGACVAIRAESLMDAKPEAWAIATYPGPLASVCPPENRGLARHGRPPRYSVMALAQHGSASISWNSFMDAPLIEKARWVRGGLMQPRRTAHWVAWQLRRIAGRAFA